MSNISKQDCRAMIDLLNDTYKDTVKMEIKDVGRGHAHTNANWFSLPKWALGRGEAFAFYYIIHEFCHSHYRMGHNALFTEYEKSACAKFGYTLDMKRVYPKAIAYNGINQYTWRA